MVLLNLDAGEHAAESPALWAAADIVCVACGGHAGDEAAMDRLAAFCAQARERPRLGAHPSYPDRKGFGRRTMPIAPAALAASLAAQLQTLATIAHRYNLAIGWIKPHGALYHDAAKDPALAQVVLQTVGDRHNFTTYDAVPAIIGPPTGALADAARARGVPYLREGFADRAMRPDGSLVPRSEPGALVTDPAACARQARELASRVDTICIHGDTPSALDIITAVRAAL